MYLCTLHPGTYRRSTKTARATAWPRGELAVGRRLAGYRAGKTLGTSNLRTIRGIPQSSRFRSADRRGNNALLAPMHSVPDRLISTRTYWEKKKKKKEDIPNRKEMEKENRKKEDT